MTAHGNWTAEQWTAISERRAELLVSAAAGSGKTSVLIERVLRAVLGLDDDEQIQPGQALSLERILVLTFTRAAAAELRARLYDKLQQASANAALSAAQRELLRAQLTALPRAQISTIDSFCAELLRRFGHTRGIRAQRIMEQDEAELVRHDVATSVLDSLLGCATPTQRELALAWGGQDGIGPEDLSRAPHSAGLRTIVLRLSAFRQSLPDAQEWYARTMAYPPLDPQRFNPQHPLTAMLVSEISQAGSQLIAQDFRTAEWLQSLHPAAQFVTLLQRRAHTLQALMPLQQWGEAALAPFGEKQDDIKFKPTLLTAYRRDIAKESAAYEEIEQRNEPFKKQVERWRELLREPWADIAARENRTREMLAELWEITSQFEERYGAVKRERGLADFGDLAHGALRVLSMQDAEGRLLRDDNGALRISDAAEELRRRFALVLIDEHQDTNELQEALVQLVTRDAPAGPDGGGRPRFTVGDLKQSIYAFRLATPQLFSAARAQLAQLERQDSGQGRVIKLQANFRSRRSIVEAVNFVFDGLMTEELGGEDYSENRLIYAANYEQPGAAAGGGEPASRETPASLHLVLKADPSADDDSPAAAEATAEAANGSGEDSGSEDGELGASEQDRLRLGFMRVASVLREIKDSGQLIYDKHAATGEPRLRPVAWRDMVVLLRSVRGRIETLLEVLASAGVPAYAAGQSGFYERPEIADALSLLRIIDNPRQDIPLAAVLRGPAAGLSPEELLAVARTSHADPAKGLWERLQQYLTLPANDADSALQARLTAFTTQLTRWRDMARLTPLPELLWRVYADSGLLAAAAAAHPASDPAANAQAALREGEQRLANLIRLHDLAREFAGQQRQGLARFMRFLELNRRAAGDLGEAPLLSEAEDVVRVMSVHQAKGLEFPVVVLANIDKQFNLEDLRKDVLWQRELGLGARYVDWAGALEGQPSAGGQAAEASAAATASQSQPRRHETLGWRAVKARIQNANVSEELRILYVAMTRARERLELVGCVEQKWLDDLSDDPPGRQAKSWLGWLGACFAPAILQGAATGSARFCGPNACWEVSVSANALGALPAQAIYGAAPPKLTAAELGILRRRLNPNYLYPASSLLPLKATVTRLAHRPLEPPEADAAWQIGGQAPTLGQTSLNTVSPMFLADTSGPSAAEIGSATHRLLAALDFNQHDSQAAVESLLAELALRGVVDARAAASVNCQSVAAMVSEINLSLGLPHLHLYPELPVALLLPARDAQFLTELGLQVSLERLAPEDAVYVQGTLDLLAVRDDGGGKRLGEWDALVLDYKTDRGVSASELAARYRRQLEWYCRAVSLLLPGQRVAWALYGLGGAGLVGPNPYDAPAS